MKTSNIILSIVFGSLTLLIVTGMIQVRFSKFTTGNESTFSDMESKTTELPAFKYLVINGQHDISIETSSDNQMIQKYEKGKSLPKIDYTVNGDTLFINADIQVDMDKNYLALHIPVDQIEIIKAKNSDLRISNFTGGKLVLKLDKSSVYLGNKNGNNIPSLTVYGINESVINSSTFEVDSLDIQLDNSNASIPIIVNNLSGSINNNSDLSIKEVGHFNFSKDGSSKLSHWN